MLEKNRIVREACNTEKEDLQRQLHQSQTANQQQHSDGVESHQGGAGASLHDQITKLESELSEAKQHLAEASAAVTQLGLEANSDNDKQAQMDQLENQWQQAMTMKKQANKELRDARAALNQVLESHPTELDGGSEDDSMKNVQDWVARQEELEANKAQLLDAQVFLLPDISCNSTEDQLCVRCVDPLPLMV